MHWSLKISWTRIELISVTIYCFIFVLNVNTAFHVSYALPHPVILFLGTIPGRAWPFHAGPASTQKGTVSVFISAFASLTSIQMEKVTGQSAGSTGRLYRSTDQQFELLKEISCLLAVLSRSRLDQGFICLNSWAMASRQLPGRTSTSFQSCQPVCDMWLLKRAFWSDNYTVPLLRQNLEGHSWPSWNLIQPNVLGNEFACQRTIGKSKKNVD